MEQRSVKIVLSEGKAGEAVDVCGWVKTARHSKGVSFLEIYDGSCFSGVQCVVSPGVPGYEEDVRHLGTGASVRVTGDLEESPGKGQALEVQVREIEVVGTAGEDYPLQKKRHSFEFLRDIAHLRLRSNTFGSILRVRNAAAAAIHEFFQKQGFLYLHSPILTGSDCEGAGALFHVLATEEMKALSEGKDTGDKKFFGRDVYLTVSGQLEGEAAALAVSKVYTFGPTFRAENSNTSRHLAEFWMVEPEVAFCDIGGDMDLAEAFLKHLFKEVMERCPDDMAFFNERIDKTVLETLTHIVEAPFERLAYTDAIGILEKSGKAFEFPVFWGVDLQSEHERYLAEEYFKKPLIVTDYPKDIKAFYMYANEDGKTVRAMDVLVPKVGEIIGGAQREDRLDVLEGNMKAHGLDPEHYGWYLDLRRFGSVPHAGFGLGFERVIQFMTGMGNIRDVIPFPRVPGYAEF